ncbi:hypothetical protein [Flagellimonas zhangzhouensis]|uniref:Uncharacterized membrane protein n=1 Tax=Flagellimonas zhangzhouensis TaxID=1073328 RepID=A0A1H2YDE1_9FLAO|nr:hypothetical protein [Allomuricauda zhangzhouensis]SDQ97420.1 Uncharacterized membrane protein [Allomuricauda zhangzhouensis]SDX02559.1 Uncharacterized membrane protein [Allomuricauda zhangzhouensis]
MSFFNRSTKAMVVGGLFLIIPLLLILILLGKAWAILNPIVSGFVDFFGIHSIFGTATITVFTILVFLLICYLGGLLLRKGFIKDWGENMQDQLFLVLPSLQMFRYKIMGDTSSHKNLSNWKPILLKEESFYDVAFITKEHENGFLSIYIPDAPKMDAGQVRFIQSTECEFEEISMKDAMQALSSFGKQAPSKLN